MKIKDRDRFKDRFADAVFSCVYKGYHFVLVIGIKYEVDVILRTRCFRRLCNLSLFIEQRFEFIH